MKSRSYSNLQFDFIILKENEKIIIFFIIYELLFSFHQSLLACQWCCSNTSLTLKSFYNKPVLTTTGTAAYI
ncbi:hypothetical protein T4E_4583 [Trichinella pseudospiralis]|uniref:Uncharacterized protein n=1 Tax=Trichinella pseudospiralis TaxID=6337 RepID=A0A0V0XDA0_TRIPS|nr:hypothetical protein T4E_4583 [Trichinella pseudospiralis]